MVVRGELWWVDFGEPIGSEPGYRRPVVIVSSDRFNRSRIATVVVSAITSNLSLADAPGNVLVDSATTGLDRDSVINITQTMVIDRSRLVKGLGMLDRSTMTRVDEGLRLLLDL